MLLSWVTLMQNKEITVVTKAENMMQNITMESGGMS
jgi:hypothetical protein